LKALINEFPLEQNPRLSLEWDFEIEEGTYDRIKDVRAFYHRLINAKSLVGSFALELLKASLLLSMIW